MCRGLCGGQGRRSEKEHDRLGIIIVGKMQLDPNMGGWVTPHLNDGPLNVVL